MDTNLNSIEPLLERAEQYGNTTFELLKLKSLQKTSSVISTLMSRFLLIVILSLFAFSLTTAIALWIGNVLGHNYYGFLIVSGFYALIGLVLYFTHPFIKTNINDSIIKQSLN
jgi:ABC-type dipeptide/oligopeptide/nickel transport system permease component